MKEIIGEAIDQYGLKASAMHDPNARWQCHLVQAVPIQFELTVPWCPSPAPPDLRR